MTLEDILRLHEVMPPGSSISLSKEAVGELLDGLGSPEPSGPVPRDLSLKDVADRVGRTPSTVRGWCGCGLLAGAYKLNGWAWRVPEAALDAFLHAEEERRAGPTIGGHNLSAWRKDHDAKASLNQE